MAKISRKAPRPEAPVHDELIMGTNNSSIVSKRSVERMYFPHENFFRPFVQKAQRRAPLINRGYWLRMKAIDYIVRRFLVAQSDKPKVIMNLGCGYDPLPFQCLSRYPTLCKSVKFVDIDYKALLLKKRSIIRSATELNGMLTNTIYPENGDMLLESEQYIQIGCDLHDISKLSSVLRSTVDLEGSLVLCTAEVSITYMDVEAADALIGWARSLPEAWFCLLEQIIPRGPEHPFAATMLAHFSKLRTPLNSIKKYQTTLHQKQRFTQAGWLDVKVWNLWELWGTSDFMTVEQRTALDHVEPFDEWEEFILFACHYFLLVAKSTAPPGLQPNTEVDQARASFMRMVTPPQTPSKLSSIREHRVAESASIKSIECPKACGRRFGASLPIRGSDRRRDLVGNFGGLGLESRLSSCDVYVSNSSEKPFYHQALPEIPPGRMCQTITDLGDSGALLVGGRASPDHAFSDCWLFHKWTNTWERVDDLPAPRYRHSASAIGNNVLVFSGKSDSRTFHEDILIWNRCRGWITCTIKVLGSRGLNCDVPVRFGAIFVVHHETLEKGHINGILAGGMSRDRLISDEVWLWTLDDPGLEKPCIIFEKQGLSSILQSQPSLARFGCTVIPHLGRIFLIGGVAHNRMYSEEEEIISMALDSDEGLATVRTRPVQLDIPHQSLLIVGSSATSRGSSIVIFGGGAVCFSFGAFWNNVCITLDLNESTANSLGHQDRESADKGRAWRYCQTFEIPAQPMLHDRIPSSPSSSAFVMPAVVAIPRRHITSSADFAVILQAAKPVILEGLELGNCKELWTSQYLKEKVGADRKIVVHQSLGDHMDFSSKNFSYVTKSFGEFIDAIDIGEKLYLRSLSSEKPAELPTDFEKDYPTIAADFRLPTELSSVIGSVHSSPLRISGPVNMWLHYDVMANVLCQIRGSKRLMLFPPLDVRHFDFKPGSSSSSVDVFKVVEGMKLTFTHPHEAILQPGDILFLPALWLHAAMPIGKASVAVNVFFRSLEDGYAAGKDVYGNRDLQAYEKGRKDVAKIEKSFSKLPLETRCFYMQRLAEELREKSWPS